MERTEHPQYDRCFEYSFRVRKKVFLNIAYHFDAKVALDREQSK